MDTLWIILLLGAATLAWFVWLAYSDSRKLHMLPTSAPPAGWQTTRCRSCRNQIARDTMACPVCGTNLKLATVRFFLLRFLILAMFLWGLIKLVRHWM